MNNAIRGYAEGYYGRLPVWSERLKILDSLRQHGMNTYLYAPKEDPCHRQSWRQPYDRQWQEGFSDFCRDARLRQITAIAGVAPGIDFDFRHLPGGPDFEILVLKCCMLLNLGANGICLLMDDIDADFHTRNAGIASEGIAHGLLANALATALSEEMRDAAGQPLASGEVPGLWVTPRIYADELAVSEPHYLPDFLDELDPHHTVLYCGSDIVSRKLCATADSLVRRYSDHKVVIWDNLYANDYCPRRLFTGPWLGRSAVDDILLNPTGMIQTDLLLLDLMASFSRSHCPEDIHRDEIHRKVLQRHGVPEQFLDVLPYFFHPVFNDKADAYDASEADEGAALEALEVCLWRWKSPLSREWYPYLFGLKHDLLLHRGELSEERIHKTQNLPMVRRLLQGAGSR